MPEDYPSYVRSLADLYRQAEHYALGPAGKPDRAAPAPDAPVALLLSPHPDDECVFGLLPLRLAVECGWRIVNVPVTHGSDVGRQTARHAELMDACTYLGWELADTPTATDDQDFPPFDVAGLTAFLQHYQPQVVFLPHAKDWNSRHLWTHELGMTALQEWGDGWSGAVVETEFWGAMDDPNLMVEGTPEQLGELVTALACHTGEVQRNPYHLRLPAWMMDNVRRGAERIAGQGGTAPEMLFATLYRVSRLENGQPGALKPRCLTTAESPDICLPLKR